MRCYLCALPITDAHFPRADEDGSALVFRSASGERVQHYVHRACMACSKLPARATRMHWVHPVSVDGNPGRVCIDPEELSVDDQRSVVQLAYQFGWDEQASWPLWPPDTERIRINLPDEDSRHRDYLARFVEYP